MVPEPYTWERHSVEHLTTVLNEVWFSRLQHPDLVTERLAVVVDAEGQLWVMACPRFTVVGHRPEGDVCRMINHTGFAAIDEHTLAALDRAAEIAVCVAWLASPYLSQ